MKKICFVVFVAFCFMACASKRLTVEEKAKRAENVACYVDSALENRDFTVAMDFMYPLRGGQRNLEYGYDVRLHGDSLYSCLPYFGRAYNVPYGGGKGLNFSAVIAGYSIKQVKSDRKHVEIYAENDEDKYLYILDVFDDGSADLMVRSNERESIRFSGKIVLPDNLIK